MPAIIPHLGNWTGIKRYIEPFCGSLGSALNAQIPNHVKIELSDANKDIIELYEEIRNDHKSVEELTNSFSRDEKTYYEIRAWDRDPTWPENKSKLQRAARTLYLNKIGFNGLYRTNKHGHFTAAWCKTPKKTPIEVGTHTAFIDFVKNRAHIKVSDWKPIVNETGPGDLIYCDPPYVDLKNPKKDFSGYLGTFGWKDQLELKVALEKANARGARVVISNSWCPATLELYTDWNQTQITAERYLSAKSSSRGEIPELLAWLPAPQQFNTE